MAAPAVQHAPAAPLSFSRILGLLALAGLIAGALAALWLLVVTEPAIRPALELEEARAPGQHHVELFGRATQQLGGALGLLLAGVGLSLVFALVFALVRHRLPGRSDLARVTLLAAIGFGIGGVLPAITIPANPPAVGNQATVVSRTGIYLAVVLCGAVIAMLVAVLVSVLQDRGVSAATTAVAATVLTVALVAAVVLLLPDSPDTVPDDVPATVIWNFRLAALGQQAVLWAGLGLAGGWLLDRRTRATR